MLLLSDPDDGPDKVRVQVVEGRGVHIRVNNHSANEFTQRQLINRQVGTGKICKERGLNLA